MSVGGGGGAGDAEEEEEEGSPPPPPRACLGFAGGGGTGARHCARLTFSTFFLLIKYSSFFCPTCRRSVTSAASSGRRSSELSNTISTYADTFCSPSPLCSKSVRVAARGSCASPNTKEIASKKLDLPLPLRPTTMLVPRPSSTVVFL